jgi:hypothetical protein
MMGKKSFMFECGKQVLTLPWLPEYEAELKSSNKPLVIRAYLHEDHAHILRIDAQGAARGYLPVNVFNESAPKTGDGLKISYKCEICGQTFKFIAKKTPLGLSNANNSASDAGVSIPPLDPTFNFIHIHKAGDKMHAYNMRVSADGNMMYCKPITLIPNRN